MGAPILDARRIPITASNPRNFEIEAGGETFRAGAVSMGNPHCLILVDDVSAVDARRLGPLLENHPLFPERANISFVQPLSRKRAKVVVWERGAGITEACGTAASAVAVHLILEGLADSRLEVELPGGVLALSWEQGSDLFLEGPAREVFRGRLLTFE
jgi:diaminopimelate epimerase